MTSELNTKHDSINISGHIIVIDYNIFIGLFWMNCRFQGTDEGLGLWCLMPLSTIIQ